MIFEFSGQNEWVKNDVLGIINSVKDKNVPHKVKDGKQ